MILGQSVSVEESAQALSWMGLVRGHPRFRAVKTSARIGSEADRTAGARAAA
jgi:hypothetical protein